MSEHPSPIPDHLIWRGSLASLRAALEEKARAARGRWAWFALSRGLVVAMRAHLGPHAFELRVARAEAPADHALFDREVAVLLRHFGGPFQWRPIEGDHGTAGGIVRLFAAVPAAEIRCVRCGGPAAIESYKEPVCTSCATALGQEEIVSRGRR